MALNANALIQEACELTSMVGDGEAAEGTLAASCLQLLNRTVSQLNNDNYFAAALMNVEKTCAGKVYFKKLEEGEDCPEDVIDMEAPEVVEGVSRQVGIRWLPLYTSNPQDMMAVTNMTLPSTYCYQVYSETAPSGDLRLVGELMLNGHGRSTVKIFYNRRFPEYKITDDLGISPLYHDAILYSLAVMICHKYKLKDYLDDMERLKSCALAQIDRNAVINKSLENGTRGCGSYLDGYYNGMAGAGLAL